MNAQIPPTTLKLLNAAKAASAISDRVKITKIVIRGDGEKERGIHYFPQKNIYVGQCIEKAGIADLVRMFCFDTTRYRVAAHFRAGVYDISKGEIKILK